MTKARKIELTQKELKDIFKYNPETGIFTWKVVSKYGKSKVGDTAGVVHKITGYCMIMYQNRNYLAHRLAWLYVYGDINEELNIDHLDRNKANNRIENLRLCTQSENMKNTVLRKDSTTRVTGVSWYKPLNKWCAYASLNKKRVHIGYYNEKKDAIIARENFCLEHYGEFYQQTKGELK